MVSWTLSNEEQGLVRARAQCGSVVCHVVFVLHVGGVLRELCALHHERRMRWMGVVGKWEGEETNKWALQINAEDEGTMLNKFRTKG